MKRSAVKLLIDLALWTLAAPLAFWFRLEEQLPAYAPALVLALAVGTPVKALVLLGLRFERRSWHRLGLRDLFPLSLAVGGYTLAYAAAAWATGGEAIPRSVPFIEAMGALLLLGTVRVAARVYYEDRFRRTMRGGRARRVLIVGAGDAGVLMAREMHRHPEAQRYPIGFVDDDPAKRRQRVMGLPVLGTTDEIPAVVAERSVDEVLIAMPSQGGRVIRRVMDRVRESGAAHRTIPSLHELLTGQVSISQIREVNLEDLLRREPVRLELERIGEALEGKAVLVTGAGGSIGSEIVRQIARFQPRLLVLLGRGENSIYLIHRELERQHPELRLYPVITDVRDRESLAHTFERFRPDVVFHAAAHKHVPMMEENPEQAIYNTVVGTRNLVELALEHGVERFVNISTDKAVNPTSIMGATKRVAELVVHDAAQRCGPAQAFVSVRFGNVLGSRGSVVPLFKAQIQRGGPVTVTHPEMRRYFMTIPEASQLVLQAGAMAESGQVYVLDMGEPVRIVDLARDLIQLCGLEPERDVAIEFTGMRAGEKLFEELLTAEEGTETSSHEKIFVARKSGAPEGEALEVLLGRLLEAARRHSAPAVYDALAALIPTNQFAPRPASGDGFQGEVDVRVLGETALVARPRTDDVRH